MRGWELAAALAKPLVLAAFAAACSDTDVLEGGTYPSPAGDGTGVKAPSNGATGSSTASASGETLAHPIPAAGPGSADSVARKFFIEKVFPTLGTCNVCHATGNLGAPKFLAQDPAVAYQAVDVHALIVDQSLLLTKGTHGGGAAPALDANQTKLVVEWLALESKERVGQAAPVNILEKIGACLDQTLFDAVKFQDLRTTRRDNENANNCTGCNNAPCRTCHTGGDGNFYMAAGSTLDKNTFAESQKAKFIVKYIGLNGTTPVPSNAIQLKSDATVTDRPYSHPMYTIPAEMKTRLDAFVTTAITKYQNKQCGQ